MARFNRSTLDKTLALGGIIVILLQVLMMADFRLQVAIVLFGILVNQVGVWGLANRLMPERRSNDLLRREVDGFIELVRHLNSQYTDGDYAAAEVTKSRLQESTDRIASIIERSAPERRSALAATGVSESTPD